VREPPRRVAEGGRATDALRGRRSAGAGAAIFCAPATTCPPRSRPAPARRGRGRSLPSRSR